MGVVLAASPAMPALADFTGQIAIQQGRADDDGRELRSLQMMDTDIAPVVVPSQVQLARVDDDNDPDEVDSPQVEEPADEASPDQENVNIHDDRRRTVAAAQTVPALPLHLRPIHRSRASEDPLGQLDAEVPSHQSSPSFSGLRAPPRSVAPNTPDDLLEKYDNLAQIQLLRGHYCHSEVCQPLSSNFD